MKYYGLICYTGIKQIYKDLAMKKLCPVCNTLNEAIGFNLSEKEIHNISKIGLSEQLCKTCYQTWLAKLLESTKAELIPLNKEKEITQTAYHNAYEAWKAMASLYQAIDYNLSLIKHVVKQKEATITKKAPKEVDPINAELFCKQFLATLSKEQQAAIIQTFKATQTIGI